LTKPWRTLSGDRKEQIVALVRTAIDALGFENCATHTEMKLMANGGISFLETAARMGGVAMINHDAPGQRYVARSRK
jgi:biotin carboxylase